MARPKTDDPKAKARIIRAARKLFAARGYSGTAIRDIAAEAGLNPAMIHYYFGSKEGLYRVILESAASEIRARLLEKITGTRSMPERLAAFVKAYATYIFSHPDLARILLREFMSGGKHFKELAQKQYLTNYTLVREAMREGVATGELRDLDTDLAPFSLIGMVLIFQLAQPLISLAIGTNKYDEQFIDRLTSHTVELFLAGAAGNKAKKSRGVARRV